MIGRQPSGSIGPWSNVGSRGAAIAVPGRGAAAAPAPRPRLPQRPVDDTTIARCGGVGSVYRALGTLQPQGDRGTAAGRWTRCTATRPVNCGENSGEKPY